MYCGLRQVLRCLLALIQRECGQCKQSGGLLVVGRALCESPAILTVSAAGAWCDKPSKCALTEALERLSLQVSPCESIHQEELQKFIDNFGCLFFTYSFHVGNTTSQSVEAEQSKIQKFLHRLSLIHAQVKIIFEIRTESTTYKQIFSGETGSKVSVMDNHISMDTAAYGQSPFSVRGLRSCPRMHPVLGDTLSFVLPTDTIEAGLCGEMSIVTMATLAPCMDQYSNWPTRLSCIRIVQSMWHASNATNTNEFPQEFGYFTVLGGSRSFQSLLYGNPKHPGQETRCSDALQQSTVPECSNAVEQTLTVFIFAQYTDPFHSQITDFINNEEVFERHLDAVLWYNEDQLRMTLMSTMKNTLKGLQRRHRARQRLNSAIPIVLSSVNSIIASSTNGEFRKACFDSLRVKSTCELHASLQRSLQSVVNGRFAPRRMCNNEKVTEAVSSQQSGLDIWEEAAENLPELFSKRTRCDLESSSLISKKRQSKPFSETLQGSKFSPVHLPQSQPSRRTAEKPSALSPATQINEQVEKQWLQELENFSEWD